MKHLLSALVFAAACGATAADSTPEALHATTSGPQAHAKVQTALNFTKIIYGFGIGIDAAHAVNKADEAAESGTHRHANTRTAFNFPKIHFTASA